MSDLLADGRFDAGNDPLRPDADALLESWARRVRANREQVERFAEQLDGPDRYGPVAGRFRADPRRGDDPSLAAVLALARPDEVWLDVGAGGGRYTLPLALAVRETIAVDSSPGMLEVLAEGAREHGIENVRIVSGRWPAAAADPSIRADVSFISQVGYDVEEIGPFLDGLERAANRRCVALLLWRRPTWAMDRLWPSVHGVERARLPGLREMVTLLMARGRPVSIQWIDQAPISFESLEQAVSFGRHQTWVRPGSEKDRRLGEAIAASVTERDGRLAFDWTPWRLGLLTWPAGTVPVPDA